MRLIVSLLIVSVAVLSACSPAPPSYQEALATAREEKDRMLRESAQSPVPAAARAKFPPLQYYAIDESYRSPAALKPPARNAPVIVMPTSTGQQRKMRRAGTLEFSLQGQPLKLSAFSDLESPVPQRLFVPFGDFTNGRETYPGGRYLDLDPTATGLYEIDFNRAYNPYCAYNPEYDCPFPPPENRLKVPVRAGEKLPAGH
ncbi:MAG TPA: DUF1684 domain-containing protein [Vicinamibacterales bacterium]|nr:DUF1684 domain-containing protein [Vicinamibacterales bacterium]